MTKAISYRRSVVERLLFLGLHSWTAKKNTEKCHTQVVAEPGQKISRYPSETNRPDRTFVRPTLILMELTVCGFLRSFSMRRPRVLSERHKNNACRSSSTVPCNVSSRGLSEAIGPLSSTCVAEHVTTVRVFVY